MSMFKEEHGRTTFYVNHATFDRVKRDRDRLEKRLGEGTRDGFVEIRLGQKPVDEDGHRCWWFNIVTRSPRIIDEMKRIVGAHNICEIHREKR